MKFRIGDRVKIKGTGVYPSTFRYKTILKIEGDGPDARFILTHPEDTVFGWYSQYEIELDPMVSLARFQEEAVPATNQPVPQS